MEHENDYRDYLTQLYNRKWLFEKGLDGSDRHVSVSFMDVDNFKTVNDVYGHEEGDHVLSVIAASMRNLLEDACAIRISGDEFALLYFGTKTKKKLREDYERLSNAIAEREDQHPGLTVISLSAGIVRNANTTEGIQRILNRADNTMYEAKRSGKHCCVFYEDIEEKTLREQWIRDNVYEALEKEAFSLYVYPVLNVQSQMLEHAPISAIWRREDGSRIYVDEFWDILENTGFMSTLILTLFEKVCREFDLTLHRQSKKHEVRFSFRISWHLLADEATGEKLKEILDRYQLVPEDIDLAVSEESFSERNMERILHGMKALKDMGFSFTVMKFGSTFRSIRWLRTLPVSTISLDSQWLKTNLADEKGRKIVKSLIRLAKETGRRIHATGIETEEEIGYLTAFGCDGVQRSFHEVGLLFEEYRELALEKMSEDNTVEYRFFSDYEANMSDYQGNAVGPGLTFTSGISEEWGGLHFPGGEIGENLLNLPAKLFPRSSFTVSMWIRPEQITSWTSAIFMRYLGGFVSLIPYATAEGDISIFRLSEDQNVGVWHDISVRSVKTLEWNYLTVTYDSATQTSRYFINGRKAGIRTDIPTLIGCRTVELGGDPFQKSFEGRISGLSIDTYSKTDEEIAMQYRSFLKEPGFCGTVEEYWKD